MLIGTYTAGNDGKGIYLFDFDNDSGNAKLLDTEKVGNPSFLTVSDDKRFVYSVGEFEACVYSLELNDDHLHLISSVPACGADPCNILIVGDSVLTSNYTGGSLSFFPINMDGTLGEMNRQFCPGVGSHIHCAVTSPDGKFIFVTDLGRDAIYRFEIGSDSEPSIAYRFDNTLHPGPRHMIFSADGHYAYLLHELGDLISVFSYSDGELSHISTELAYHGGGHGSADLHIGHDGKFLYTSHRLKDDGISVFEIGSGGKLKRVDFTPTGSHPRNFAISPGGRFLLCACRDSNRVDIFTIGSDGLLVKTDNCIEIPAPVCIKFFL